ncbi:MAG: hypothetical protein ACLP8A_03405 [Methylovirgula sp.]
MNHSYASVGSCCSDLHQLPDLVILAIIVVYVTGLAMLAAFIRRHIFRLREKDSRGDAAFKGFKAVMSMTGIILRMSPRTKDFSIYWT